MLAATSATLLVAGADQDAVLAVGTFHWRALASGIPYAAAVLAILGAHEMGHYLACRRYGIPATLPFFIPGLPPFGTFGAVIRIRGIIPHRRALFDVAVAGPLAGFAVAVPVLAWGIATAQPFEMPATPEFDGLVYRFGMPPVFALLSGVLEPPVPARMNAFMMAGWLGMLVTALNLFPVGQLDGGHAVYALSRRLHRVLARLTIAAVAGLIVWQAAIVRILPTYGVWFLVLIWMRDRHPPVLDETVQPGRGRLAIALALLVMFALTFSAIPLRIVGE